MNHAQDEHTSAEAAPSPPPGDPAAAAFEVLREEVALVRRAVAGLAAERASIEMPDYSETLAALLQASAATAKQLKALGEAPALQMSASTWGRQIADAGKAARHDDHLALSSARIALDEATENLRGAVRSARDADRQKHWLMATGIAAIFAGVALWVVISGLLAPLAPATRQSPEQRAATILGMSEVKAGERLIQTASPSHWLDLVLGDRIVIANRETLRNCEHHAHTRRERCVIEIPLESN